jgi:colicin import membrane protein
MRMDPAEREAKQAQAKEQAEKREADEWRKKEELYAKKAAHSALRIEEMEREMDELRQKARQTEQSLDEEKRRAAQRERDLKRQVELMSEAEEIARRRGAATTMKVVKPIRATIKEQLFQRKSLMLKRRELAGVVLKEGWLTKEGGLVRNWKKVRALPQRTRTTARI